MWHLDIQILTLNEEPNIWTCIWQSGSYSVSKAYRHLSGHVAFKRIWKSSCLSKHKVLGWLMLKDRLSIRELLRRKNMELQDYNCVLCNGLIEESLCHLFIHCPFATSCWNWLQVQTDQQDGFSSEYRVVQKAAPSAFLHRDHNNHVLDNLEGKKWTDFQPNPTFNSSIQERVQRWVHAASFARQKEILSLNRIMVKQSSLISLAWLIFFSFFSWTLPFSLYLLVLKFLNKIQ